jgi:hypothetical protein
MTADEQEKLRVDVPGLGVDERWALAMADAMADILRWEATRQKRALRRPQAQA